MPGVFIPGWGASPALYRGLVPSDWDVLELPSFRASKGALAAYRAWLRDELARRQGPITLGGHSFGAALAVLAANDSANVDRLVLLGPAGLPLSKPIGLSLRDFFRQVILGIYPLVEAARLTRAAVVAPNSAMRLARSVRGLDLRTELRTLRGRGIPCTVLAAATDTLTTPSHCRTIAELAGGDYRELDVDGGHMWFLGYETAK